MTSGTQSTRLVGGRYELGERIGAGGMAEVYLARDRQTGIDVAVKLLSPGLASDPKLVARFAAEARAAASVDHPNVVAVQDCGDDYIAMEYVPGPNLKELLRERRPLPEGEALAIAAQVAAGLEAAHARGVVHLDVKPQNVLMAPGGEAKVADFGIARALGGTGATLTTVFGSAQYVSPEQARGARVDARSDVYSLGALLYELVTGRPPFEGDAPLQVALRHLNELPEPPRRLRPELSVAAEAVVLRALAKEPAARFGSAAEMGRAIAEVGLGAWAVTQPLPLLESTQPLSRAMPVAVSASLAAAPLRGAPTARKAAGASLLWPALLLAGVALVAFAALRLPAAGTPLPTMTAPAAARPATPPATAPALPTATSRPAPSATRQSSTATPAPPTATAPAILPALTKIPVVKPGRDDDDRKAPKKDKRD